MNLLEAIVFFTERFKASLFMSTMISEMKNNVPVKNSFVAVRLDQFAIFLAKLADPVASHLRLI